jgi:aldehyde dehydrogenase (NAD+)
VFDQVDPRMTIAQEEIFGPVVSIIEYDGIEQALEIANGTIYGLHGAVFSASTEQALSVARRVRSGSVTVNGMVVDCTMPFGGFKQSGCGREGGIEGLDNYYETQTIYFA